MKIIGRKQEIAQLEACYKSDKSEFVGLYGRRRVGKTFLIREVMKDRITFQTTGAFKAPCKEQLDNFHRALLSCKGIEKVHSVVKHKPKDWPEAFHQLRTLLSSMPKRKGKKKVLFFDELPWMATNKSGFLSALEHFWNDYAAWEHDIMLIICGSASSWIVKKIIKSKGGLYNRVTQPIHLMPFTLHETESFLQAKGIRWNRYDIACCYMTMGGIPFYLDLLQANGTSLAANIDLLFFSPASPLKEEYSRLFESLFTHYRNHIKVVETLAGIKGGLTKAELSQKTKIAANGAFSELLTDLETCGFISSYTAYGKNTKGTTYQLLDFYCIFYLHFIKNAPKSGSRHWLSMANTPTVSNYWGNTFELLCLSHLYQLQKALGFEAVTCTFSAWREQGEAGKRGSQIDLVIDRKDSIINLCEMKFSRHPYEVTANDERVLLYRAERFREATQTRSAILNTLITSCGIKPGAHSGIVDASATLNDLFVTLHQ